MPRPDPEVTAEGRELAPADRKLGGVPAKKVDVNRGVVAAVDLRVGQVTAAEPVSGAPDGAWRLTVNFGPIGALVAEVLLPRLTSPPLVGEAVVAAVNLVPRFAGGFRRDFVLLVAHDDDGKPILVVPQLPTSAGSRISWSDRVEGQHDDDTRLGGGGGA